MAENRNETRPSLEEQYVKAQRMALVLCGIARIVPREEREKYRISDIQDIKAIRNTLVGQYLQVTSNYSKELDAANIQNVKGITSWFLDNLPI